MEEHNHENKNNEVKNNEEKKDGRHEQGAPHKVWDHRENRALMGILSYIGILVLIPLLSGAGKKDSFVRFHIKQGLVLLVIIAIIWFLGYTQIPFWIVFQLINIGVFILSIVGIVNVVNKKEVELPVVGRFAKYFKI